jgi:hypothetical protein
MLAGRRSVWLQRTAKRSFNFNMGDSKIDQEIQAASMAAALQTTNSTEPCG